MSRKNDKNMAIVISVFAFWLILEILLAEFFGPANQARWLVCGLTSVAILMAIDIKRDPINTGAILPGAILLGPTGLLTLLTLFLISSVRRRRRQI